MAEEERVDILFGGGGGDGGGGGFFSGLEDFAGDVADVGREVSDAIDVGRDLAESFGFGGGGGGQRTGTRAPAPVPTPPTFPPPGATPPVPVPDFGPSIPGMTPGMPGGAPGPQFAGGSSFAQTVIQWMMQNPAVAQPIVDFVRRTMGLGGGIKNPANCRALAHLLKDEHPEIWKALVMFESGATVPVRMTETGRAVFLALQVAASNISVCDME